MNKENIFDVIQHVSKEFNIDEDIIKAIIKIESDFVPEARNKYSGAVGLMQITQPALAQVVMLSGKSIRLDQLTDVFTNIWVGTYYFKWLWDYFRKHYANLSTIDLALMAYNWGIGNVSKWLKMENPFHFKVIQIPQETKDYIFKFHFWYNYYKRLPKKEG
jgi:soluble lytic murein transglycosylase